MEFGRNYKYHRTLLLTMMMFKWGIFCTATADKCLSSPCHNGGTCTDTMGDYVCLCPRDAFRYIGKDCDQHYDACAFASCPNCITTLGSEDYTCPCAEGFTGPNCTHNMDECESNPCTGIKTHCVDGNNGYTCYCPSGYGGEDCQTKVRDCSDDPCFNNATCVWAPDGYECLCARGFQGGHCEEDIDECLSQPCKNGAICQDGVDVYQCFCVPGFQGYNCEIDINECASRPCENNGTCSNERDRYVCECLLGFAGVNCEVEIDECEVASCQNGATCHDYVGLYTCECVHGYEGINCEVDINECASTPCLNDGACVDLVNSYECDCTGTGFMGDLCEEDIPECASDPCQNAATCQEGLNHYTCHCWPGYEGENCQIDIDECELQPCLNDGECYQRSDVSQYWVLPELNREFSYEDAAGYLCHCLPGFTGGTCSVNVDECESIPCQNGGTCEDLIDAYQCVCPPGFTGVVCEVNIDECESVPCQNGATCEDGISDYTCRCPAADPEQVSWGGHDCSAPLTGCVDHLCENRATCTPWLRGDQHGHTCHCPPGFHGDHCSTPTTFSFSVDGFVVVEVPHENRTRGEVEPHRPSVHLRFRTTLPDMLLFYRGKAEHFFSLEIVGGELHAKAESGDLKLEVSLPGPVSDGHWHQAFITVDEKLVLSLLGENEEELSRAEVGGHNHLPSFNRDNLERVFVGGVAPDYLNSTATRKGFIGCMEDLLIDSHPILPQNISPDQATAMELGCNKTEWCHPDPCSQRGLCVDLWTDYRCDCYRPFHGNSCAAEYTSWTFGNEHSRSYASFIIPKSHDGNFNLSLFLRSRKHNGLVFQLRRQDLDYFTVYLREGRVHIAAHPSDRAAAVYVTGGEKTLLTVAMKHNHVFFNGTGVHLRGGYFMQVSVKAWDVAYIGGLPDQQNASRWGGHFKGCLQDIRFDDVQLVLNVSGILRQSESPSYLSSAVYRVRQNCVSDDACKVKPCLNGGTCNVTWNDFECVCPFNFTGKTCETHVWCVSDPCVMGSQCVDLPDGYECLANATFENNALHYKANGSLADSVTTISMELRTREESGVLLRASSGMEVFCLGLLNSSLLVKLRVGNSRELLAFTSEVVLSDGAWHRVEVLMEELRQGVSRWHLTVDGRAAGASLVAGGNLDFLNNSTVWLAENFTGCLGDVRVGGVYLPLVDDDDAPQAARFIRQGRLVPQVGCSGAPVCHSQPCRNNGSCQDLFHLFSCACASGWEGELCQNDVDECASGPCIHGTCQDLLADYQCDCTAGYGGRDCQVELDECLEHSCENGGSCLDAVGSYSCECPPEYIGPYCQWSFPPLQCDVDVQCDNEGVCVDGIWGANCSCKPGYSGDRCEVDIDECQSSPCLNGATCLDGLNHYLCVCVPGFGGKDCENNRQQQRARMPWLVVAIPLVCLGALLAMVGLVCMVLTTRRRRQSEGTYSPSQQEVAGARLEMGSVLKVPPEERLI